MNKSLIVLSAIALAGCHSRPIGITQYTPRYKTGDCAIMELHKNPESWEKQEYVVFRILEVGKQKYHAVELDAACAHLISIGQGPRTCYESMEFDSFDQLYPLKGSNCPKLEDFASYQKGARDE